MLGGEIEDFSFINKKKFKANLKHVLHLLHRKQNGGFTLKIPRI